MAASTSAAERDALVAKHRAETEKFNAEAKRYEAEALRAQTEAAQFKVALKDAEIDLRQKQRIENELLALDAYNYTYRFNSEVSDSSVKSCIDKLTFWSRTAPVAKDGTKQPIEIVFNSPGGSVFAGMDLFDYIGELRRSGHLVKTHGRGHMASMGGILLQAGDVRSMGAESYILIHEVSTWAGGKVGDLEDEVKFLQRISARIVNIFAERAAEAGDRGTATRPITKRQLETSWKRRDWWIDSTEALALGIVDELR